MAISRIKNLACILLFCLFAQGAVINAEAAVSKTSKRVMRRSSVLLVASDFSAAALSTTSIQWSWSTAAFTSSNIDGYFLYTSTDPATPQFLAPSTSFYIDAGLGINKVYTRWLVISSAAVLGSDSEHIDKYTYALPPDSITVPVSSINATNAYVTWQFSTATAYAIETSSDAGATYFRNRAAFVPWQTIQLQSNTQYRIRLGAINGDDEVTPNVYSAEKLIATFPLNPELVGVAVSSYQIKWQWSTGTFTGTGITGYNLYRSSGSEAASPPNFYENVSLVKAVAGIATTSWTEVFTDSDTAVANTAHARWLKAEGYAESEAFRVVVKYTYAIAPATCTASYPLPLNPFHVFQNSAILNWDTGWSTLSVSGIASSYFIEYSTFHITEAFALPLPFTPVAGAPGTVPGLVENTKYDFRVGAINGDGEMTPNNAANPYAYTAVYRAITQPAPPSAFVCDPLTDTALQCNWSTTTTTVNPEFISGYGVGELKYDSSAIIPYWYWDPLNIVAGTDSHESRLDYFLTNTTHTVTMYTNQVDPDWWVLHSSATDWQYHGFYSSNYISTEAATFATPPNDVSFDTVGAHAVGLQWLEPEVPASQYFVQRSTTTGDKGPWVFVSSVTGSHYNDTGVSVSTAGLTPSTRYSYRVGAINLIGRQTIGLAAATDGNRRDYSFVRSTFTKHIAPTLYAVATGTKAITWWWTDTVAGVTSYNLYTASGGVITSGLAYPATFYAEVNLSSANARYTRRVRSIAADGEGDYSEASASTLSNPPAAAVVTSTGLHSLSLGWAANSSARYRIDRSTDGATWTGLKTWSDVHVSTYFNDTRLRYDTAYYYAVLGYNDDGAVSLSSSIISGRTLSLPSAYTMVFATSAGTATAPLPAPSVAQLSVAIPPGTPDGYLTVSTDAAASPAAISKSSLDSATAKLTGAALVPGSIVELHLYDVYGSSSSLAGPARVTITYVDATGDDLVDGPAPQAPVNTLNLFSLDTVELVWNQQNSVLNTGAKTVYSDADQFSFYALGSVSASGAFSAMALTPTSIRWSWPTVSGIDSYHLYSSSASTSSYIVLPSSANFYVDTGLGVNKAYTRWLRTSSAAVEGAESPHIRKYTYALPPDSFLLSTGTAESIYVTWQFSSATAYAIECSTNAGADYVRNRESFVPWQTIPLQSNASYYIRIGAINGDHELTPGLYSVIKTTITPPLDLSGLTAVALSSYTIKWQWSTGTFTGTGITGYRLYHSATGGEAALPVQNVGGEIVQSILSPGASFWIETFVDGSTMAAVAANSLHTRWIKAIGSIPDPAIGNLLLESRGNPYYQKYTYAIAPASTTVLWLDPAPYQVSHVWQDQVGLNWDPRMGASEASQYVVDYSTVQGFSIAVSSRISAAKGTIPGLTDNTKYDFRIGALNGDGERTPANALNPFANSAVYRLITSPRTPSDYSCQAFMDTAMNCTWSTATYVNPGYIEGYFVGELRHRQVNGEDEIYWSPWDILEGVDSSEYALDYLLTNSTHTVSIWVTQKDPDWVPGNAHYDANETEYYYNNFGSYRQDTDGATFATPPNDVVFDTVTPRAAGMWWKEPEVPATKYFVERSTNTGEDGPWVFVSSVTGPRYFDVGASTSGLTPGTTYSYRIGAINLLGQPTIGLAENTYGYRRDYSFVSSTVTKHAAPALYGTATGTGSINWAWTDAVPGVTSYNLYTATDGVLSAGLSAATTFYSEVNLSSANARYTRRVRSMAADGEGDYSEASVSTLSNPPAAAVLISSGLHSLSFGWAATGSARYKIDRSTDGSSWTTVRGWNDVFVSTYFNDTRLRYDTAYYYAVSGYNDDGFVTASSAVVSARTLPLPSGYTVVFATSAVSATAPLPAPSLALVTVGLSSGTPDGYLTISTNAGSNPVEISKASLDSATNKLRNVTLLSGSIVELHLFDVYGDTAALAGAAGITVTYVDAAPNDDIVDGTQPAAQADTLQLFSLDTAALIWNQQQNSVLNKTAKTVYYGSGGISFYALGSIAAGGAFSATALSPTSIQWRWSVVASSGVDSYHLYSSSASTSSYIVLPSTTGSYVDTGLEANRAYTRWLRVSSAAVEGADSEHVQKYTFALPPASFALSQVTSTGAYLTWFYSTATAYDIQCSTNGGLEYTRNRTSFVPGQTIQLLSNKYYRIRIGAINGDNEVTPEVYSSVQITTTPPLDLTMTGVAVSSNAIQWRWSTGTIADTGITSYRIYSDTGGVVYTASTVDISSWTETFPDGAAPAANSQHTRWIKAVGILESPGKAEFSKYTYAIAPATCGPVTPGFMNVFSDSVNLGWAPRLGASEASKYVIDYATATVAESSADFNVSLTSVIVSNLSFPVTGLAWGTKHDFRIGAINGDNEQTPGNLPYAYSARYKVITRPLAPVVSCSALTDTSLKMAWSTAAYTGVGYISGYRLVIASHTTALGDFWWAIADIPGITTHEFDYNPPATDYSWLNPPESYLLTNSTHTRGVAANQGWSPDCADSPADPACYYMFGGNPSAATCATFATPPSDVSFETVGSRSVALWWNEPEVPATRYFVERSTNAGENGPWVFVSSVTGSYYYDVGPSTAGLTPGTLYSYRIGAINQLGQPTIGLAANTGGNRRDYSFVRSTMTRHISPTLYAVAAGTKSITWWWTDTVAGVTSYNLYTATGGLIVAGLAYPATFYTEVNLPGENTSYTRRVRSMAPDGEGDYSEASASTLSNPPAAAVITSSGLHSLSLGWAAGSGAGYGLSRSTDANSWTVLKSSVDAFAATSFSDTRLRYDAAYYYAVLGYNDEGAVSVSSSIVSARTLPLPASYTVVFATSAGSVTAPLPAPSLAQLTAEIPAGTPDGYLTLSTSAAATPFEIPKSSLDAATNKLRNASLVGGSIVELHLYDVYGATSALPGPARLTMTYLDATSDDLVDGTAPPVPADTLNLFRLDTDALVWNQQNSVVNKPGKTAYSDVPRYSFYALGGVPAAGAFSATALSPNSIQWRWPAVSGADGYHLYSSSASTSSYIVLPSSASFYIDTGLAANRAYTRWLKVSSAAVEISESEHVRKYTYALPPSDFTLSQVTSTGAYITWSFSTATAYAIECSTNGGTDYSRNREAFVPWQTIPLQSNASYYIRIGAVNGDDELTPELYSVLKTTVTPPLDLELAGVALSSSAIQWRWSTGTFTGTGITGYRIYGAGGLVYSTTAVELSSWTETFTDGAEPAANSQHTRWIRAFGLLESQGGYSFSKYTYAIAPATCGAVSPGLSNVQAGSVNLSWQPRRGALEAARYVIDYATAGVAESSADFNVALTSVIVSGSPSLVSGLAWGTKHDFRIGSLNGDDEQTPDNALNPYAYSARYKVITKPLAPVHSCAGYTDTSLKWSWSTGTYTNRGYVSGYTLGRASNTAERGDFWEPLISIPGAATSEYNYSPGPSTAPYYDPYLLTNSTATRAVAAVQTWSPACADSPADPACYYYFGSEATGSLCATFATPPNDVVFDTVAPRGIGISWKEPEVPATQYRVERSTNAGEAGPWVFLSSVAGAGFQETGLLPSTTYSYRVGAINRLGFQTLGLPAATGGNRRDYSFVRSTITRHGAPTLYGTAAGTGSINWEWTDTVQGVTSYNIYTASDVPVAAGLAYPATFYLEVNLSSANARYTRRVRSIAPDGEGDYSEASALTLAKAPAGAVVTSSGMHSLSLGWTANGAARYKIDRSTDAATWTGLKNWSDVFVSTYFSDTLLRFGTTYYYAVLGYNDDGVVSVSSAIVSAATLPLPSDYALVFATAAGAASAPLPGPSVALVTVALPAGAADGYFSISTNAATNPVEISKSSLDAATRKLTSASLVAGSMVELHLYDAFGQPANLPSPARVTITYLDAEPDDVVDGTAPPLPAGTLQLFNLDTSALIWSQQQNSVVNTGAKTVHSDSSALSFYALGSVSASGAFTATALSPTSIQWSWSVAASTSSGIDSYHLYSSSMSTSSYIVLPSTRSFYVDTGLEANRAYTRWLRVSSAAVEGADSEHIQKYTFALPPSSFNLSQVTSTGAYLTWAFSNATAYEIQASTNGGLDYLHNRASFVPWQSVQLMSNKYYLLRIGAINGDNELTPETYSSVKIATTPPLDMAITGVAVSSNAIEWRWSTGSVAGTGITSYRIYRSSLTPDDGLPAAGDNGVITQELFDAAISSWTEVFADSGTVYAADSRHTRWLRASGIIESAGKLVSQKYTYATAPSTCAPAYPDWLHVFETSVDIAYEGGHTHSYLVERSTAGDFAVSLASSAGAGVTRGLTGNTKYDFRVGVFNGDNELTPENALNPFAKSAAYKVITRPPYLFPSCAPVTDTTLRWSWSTATYTNLSYISGYGIGIASNTPAFGDFWLPISSVTGANSTSYDLNYLLTNSTHTRGIWAEQEDPDCNTYAWDPACYQCFGTYGVGALCSTFATPPNDVIFDTVGAHAVGMQWNEPEVPATQYFVARSTTLGESGPWVFISSVTGSRYNDTGISVSTSGLTPSTTYSYRIGAINQLGQPTIGLAANTGGNRRDYSFVSSTVTKHIAPVLSGVGASTRSITWSWVNTVPGVTSYNLYTATGGVIALNVPATYYLEVNLSSANARYTRQVRSVAPDGEGDYSEASASTLADKPAAPALTGSGLHSLSLGWTANGAVRYKIDRSTDQVSWTGLKTWSDVFVSTYFNDTRLRYAATYYYAVLGYNDDGAVSASSAIVSGVTLPLPSSYTVVFAASAGSAAAPLPAPSLAQINVAIPAGTIDGYFAISTNAATSPLDITKASLDSATRKLRNSSLVAGSIVELHLYDVYGATASLPLQARVTITYTDANGDDLVDGTAPPLQAATLQLFNLDQSALVWSQQNSVVNTGVKTVYTDAANLSFYALGSVSAAGSFSAMALSPNSIQWSWAIPASTSTGIDSYHLYSSSASTSSYIVLPATSSFYVDTGLEVNTAYTRWLRVSSAAVEGADSEHVRKYTFALPPPEFTLSQVTSTGAYLTWFYSTATAYEIQGSTDGGLGYAQIRTSFVPWQTIQLQSNKNYLLRIGAINGDNELTPEIFSSVQVTTTPPLDMVMTGVAVSSTTIEWRWSTGTIAGTGITSYRIYQSSLTADSALPGASDNGVIAQELFDTSRSSWTEVFADAGAVYAADSRHTRWIKANGILESTGRTFFQKYTYAVAPATCALVAPEWQHVFETSVDLKWDPSPAHNYIIERSTAADFAVSMSSSLNGGATPVTAGLTENRKYDFRLRAINGDNEVTPVDGLNPLAYSAPFKVMTRPRALAPTCAAFTDTALRWSWSTGTYTGANYISGYGIGIASNTQALGNFWLQIASMTGVNANNYTLDYLLTNSTHTRGVWSYQADPACVTYPEDPACYRCFGSLGTAAMGSTFATPPNDVSFGTVASHAVGLWWNESEVPATQYFVARSTTLGESGPWVFVSSVTGPQYNDTGVDISTVGLAASTTYSYRIGAINQLGQPTLGLAANTGGNRRDYSFVSSTVTRHISPTLFAVASGTRSITWWWTDTVPGVTSYNLYTDTGGAIIRGLSAATTFYSEVTPPGANVRYTRRVRSMAPDGEGDYAEASASTLANPPAGLIITSSGVHTMALGWTANSSARYRIDRSPDGSSWAALKTWSDVVVSTYFSDSSLHFATPYYYAVFGYNDDQIVSVSSTVTSGTDTTLPVPPAYTAVFATAAVTQSMTAPLPGVDLITVEFPAGAAPDGYMYISTSAAASPVDVSKANLDAATAKLTNTSLLNIVELHLYDAFGAPLTANLASPARITITYTDANGDDIVDATSPQAPVNALKLFNLDTSALVWNPLSNSVLNKSALSVYADVPHFSFYALGSVISSIGLLAETFAYPNPYRPGSSGDFGQSAFGDGIVFQSLPAKARIRIFSLSGAQVAELNDDDGDGRCLWNTRNPDGAKVASGVYLYIVNGPGSSAKKTGKIAIIR